jgi:hypothetical protein
MRHAGLGHAPTVIITAVQHLPGWRSIEQTLDRFG